MPRFCAEAEAAPFHVRAWLGPLTVDAVELVLLDKGADRPGECLAGLRVGCHGGELRAAGAAADGHERLEVRVGALQLGEGREATLLAVGLDACVGPLVNGLDRGQPVIVFAAPVEQLGSTYSQASIFIDAVDPVSMRSITR